MLVFADMSNFFSYPMTEYASEESKYTEPFFLFRNEAHLELYSISANKNLEAVGPEPERLVRLINSQWGK